MSEHPHGSPPRQCRILETSMPARTLKRLRVKSPCMKDIPLHPGQQVRVKVGDGDELTLRTYSVWDYHPGEGWMDLVVMLHGNGPGSAWAEGAVVGDEVTLFGPLGSFVVNPRAEHHVFVGDETAAVAMQAMIRSLPDGMPYTALFEGARPEDALASVGSKDAERWVFRGDEPAGAGSAMCRELAAMDLPGGQAVVYLAGEMGAVLGMRDFLLAERGWKRMALRCKTFWAQGKVGLT